MKDKLGIYYLKDGVDCTGTPVKAGQAITEADLKHYSNLLTRGMRTPWHR